MTWSLFCLLLSLTAAAAASLPQFPEVWKAGTVDGIAIFQGGVKKPDGEVCCAGNAAGCKVQTVTLAGTTYNDGAHNRTRTDNAQGIIVNWYDPVNKQMLLLPNPAGKGYVCTAACPTEGEYEDPLKVAANSRDVGQVEVNGVLTHEWVGHETLLKVIRMTENDFYIDQSDATAPKPVSVIEKLTPFDIPIVHPVKELGESATNYTDFSPSALDPELFNIVNCSTHAGGKVKCHCPKPQNGCNDNNNFARSVFARKGMVPPKTITQLAPALPLHARPSRKVSKTAKGQWANDWSAMEHAKMLINQGGTAEADGSYCCLPQSVQQCQVQLQNGGGQRYMDYSNNRTRLEAIDGSVSVDDFKRRVSMEVVHNGSHDVCKQYCPIDPLDTLDGGAAFFLDDQAQDLGQVTFQGHNAEHWQWKDKILKIITMSTTDFYATLDSTATYKPLAQVQNIAPFGRHLAQSNMTWASFTPGKQPATKFDIHGVDSCPQDPQCDQPNKQLRRLMLRQYHTFARYQTLFT